MNGEPVVLDESVKVKPITHVRAFRADERLQSKNFIKFCHARGGFRSRSSQIPRISIFREEGDFDIFLRQIIVLEVVQIHPRIEKLIIGGWVVVGGPPWEFLPQSRELPAWQFHCRESKVQVLTQAMPDSQAEGTASDKNKSSQGLFVLELPPECSSCPRQEFILHRLDPTSIFLRILLV